ncbi:PGF-CTERM-anchored ABC transporter substrate-binding protein [Halopenitus sp. H-Gu1]|uniref:PGF-CTERM-anchored ABC transporter substrate-binding protein n=1 Tax=Halopenitus sp. H-Gu1 TaxID=3242697 RepID=UPI00359E2516
MRTRTAVTVALVATILLSGMAMPVGAVQSIPSGADVEATQESCTFPVERTDASGETLRLEERPERVTTTNPSAAQTMWEIGGRSQVVGVTRYASYLEGADERTDVSSEFGVSIEEVAGTEPDLVLVPNTTDAEQLQKMRETGLPVYHLPRAHSIEDIAAKTTTIGRLTGNCEGAAETNAWMNESVEAARVTVEDDADRPTVLYPLGSGYVAAGDTFIDEMISAAGARNVAAENHTGYPQLNAEIILRMDPEYILITDRESAIIEEEPYASTTAGQENNTIYVPVQWVNQPAPRSVVYTVENVSTQLETDSTDATATPTETDDASPVDDGTETAEPTDSADEDATAETTADDAPGFGPAIAAVAIVVTALLSRRLDR